MAWPKSSFHSHLSLNWPESTLTEMTMSVSVIVVMVAVGYNFVKSNHTILNLCSVV